MPYETTPEGDQFLRSFIMKWMEKNAYEIPAAATPTELLDSIETQALIFMMEPNDGQQKRKTDRTP